MRMGGETAAVRCYYCKSNFFFFFFFSFFLFLLKNGVQSGRRGSCHRSTKPSLSHRTSLEPGHHTVPAAAPHGPKPGPGSGGCRVLGDTEPERQEAEGVPGDELRSHRYNTSRWVGVHA